MLNFIMNKSIFDTIVQYFLHNSLIRSIILTGCILLTGAYAIAREKEPFSLRNFTKQEYSAESQNWSVTLDQNGFVYAANNIGLLEFDGIEWNFYPSPGGTILRSVAVDGQNRIFTSGYREIGYWERDAYGNLNYHSLNELAAPLFSQNEEFWNTVVTNDKVYFHSFSSIFIYDYKQFRVVRPGNTVGSIHNIDGRICVHIADRGLYMLEDTTLLPFIDAPELRENLVYFVKPFQDSSLLIGTDLEGLFVYKNDRLIPYLSEWKPYFMANNINRGAVSEQGDIIIGTLIDGIVIFDRQGNLKHRINHSNGLQNNTVLGIALDRNSNIWLSLDKGIDFVSFHIDPSFTYHEQNEIGAVYAAALYEGNLYLATNQGVFYRKWENETDEFTMVPGTQGQAWSTSTHNGELLIGHNRGTFRIRQGRAELISNVSGGFSFVEHPENSRVLIQSTYSNMVFFEQGPTGFEYKYQLTGFNDLIRYIEPDHLNNIWASHMHRGIYKLELSDDYRSILNAEYYGNSIFGQDYNIQVFKVENRIVFTTSREVYTYDDLNDTIITFEKLNPELGKYTGSHRIVSAPDHHYWFISQNGIALFRFTANSCELVREYPNELFQDHQIIGYENIYPLSAREAILCLDNGYVILRTDQPDLSSSVEDKQLYLKGVGVRDNAGISEYLPLSDQPIRVPYTKRNLTFSYSFPLYSNETVEYQTFVEGLDKAWSPLAEKPIFNLDRLPPGEYEILVRAVNKWNRTSKVNTRSLVIQSPWYLKTASIVIYLVIIVLLIVWGRHILIQRMRHREKSIRESKEKELIRLRNEKLNAELSHRSQELANSTMSIINKNEFLMNLKETLKKRKYDLGSRYPDKYYNQIISKIDNNISSMDDWKVFEFHFEKAHEKFLSKLMNKFPRLNHNDLRLCAYLRMNLTSKEIAPLLRITVRGVENHRYKLRKKLNLHTEENLTDFIMGI